MKRFKRAAFIETDADPEKDGGFRDPGRKQGLNVSTLVVICVLVGLSLFATLSFVYKGPPLGWSSDDGVRPEQDLHKQKAFGGAVERGEGKIEENVGGVVGGRNLEGESEKANENTEDELKDKLLGGLLSAEFDERTCLSRYHSAYYRKASKYKPSPYLVERLRRYETLQKQCGPYTELYNKTVRRLKSGAASGNADCQYVVWIPNSGLGNKILSIASAFLYALLTNRILLLDGGADLAYLFCEPFPENSWLLPLDFPLNQLKDFDRNSSERYGHILKKIGDRANNASIWPLSTFIYVHLAHDYDDHDKLFFCDNEQLLLQRVHWLFMRSDNYFVPSLYLMPNFEEELSKLFPEKDSVFHHLGRYLFQPTNTVWGMITRFYDAYLVHAEEKIGIQIRTFETESGPFQHVLDQVLACAKNMEILPQVSAREPFTSWHKPKGRRKSILITSLNGGYFEWIRNMYWDHPTMNGEVVSVYQPSHEEYQQTEKSMHNIKALAEMYLLSLNDVLVTSAWSTFGYVAQGLGGIKPWILFKPENHTAPDPPCRRAMSFEPCFHAPPFYDCKAKIGIDTGNIVPHVKHCEDMSWGLKVIGKDEL